MARLPAKVVVMTDEGSKLLLEQILKGQTELFVKIDDLKSTVSEQSKLTAVLQERESDDRLTIMRIGGDLRTCKATCEKERKEQSHQSIDEKPQQASFLASILSRK